MKYKVKISTIKFSPLTNKISRELIEHEVNLENLTNGTYTVRLIQNGNQLVTGKFVINK